MTIDPDEILSILSPCDICGRPRRTERLELDNHYFCNWGCQAVYQTSVPLESRWMFAIARSIQDGKYMEENRERGLRRAAEMIANSIEIRVRWKV